MTLQIDPDNLVSRKPQFPKVEGARSTTVGKKAVKIGQVDGWLKPLKVVKSGTRLRNSGVVKLNLRLLSKG